MRSKNIVRALVVALGMLALPAVGHAAKVSVEARFTVTASSNPIAELLVLMQFIAGLTTEVPPDGVDRDFDLDVMFFQMIISDLTLEKSVSGSAPPPALDAAMLVVSNGEPMVNADVLGFWAGDPGWEFVPFGTAAQFQEAQTSGTVSVPFFSYFAQDWDGTAINTGDLLVDALNNMPSAFSIPLGGALYTDLTVGGSTERVRYFLTLDSVTASVSAVPVPAALPLFFSGLLSLGVFIRRRGSETGVSG